MKLSIIVVNYNVCYFLEQALRAVESAIELAASSGYLCECIVVDNNSQDKSVEMMRSDFPHIPLIANKENTGFSKANNQGIAIAKGEFVLLLNPDTVVAEDTFVKVLEFVDAHPECGGLGIKMIDGRGNFLPESKRGIPTPRVSLYKLLGLSKVFPKSRTFNQYHLGFLDKNQTCEAPILSGAFMLLRKSVLDEIGLLDETFFMYGEDIDLSYRIVKAGYKNYYFADSSIIHYKGESTKKGSLNYVRIFYKAMLIFAQKHFAGQQNRLFTLFIEAGIYVKASTEVLSRVVRWLFPFLLDSGIVYLGFYFIKEFWANNVKAAPNFYEGGYMTFNVPLYIFLWLVSIYFSGGYDRPFSIKRLIRGLLVGTVLIAATYGFLPETYRFSRAMIVMGMLWSILSLSAWRWFAQKGKTEGRLNYNGKLAIVGNLEESKRIRNLLLDSGFDFDFVGFVLPDKEEAGKETEQIDYSQLEHPLCLGSTAKLKKLVDLYKIDELIFCSDDFSYKSIIHQMEDIGNTINYKISSGDSTYLIGSNSKNTAGDLYINKLQYKILQTTQIRNKRVFDIGMCLMLLVCFPILLFVAQKPFALFQHILSVFWGNHTWVGFGEYATQIPDLPIIKDSVFSPIDLVDAADCDLQTVGRLLKGYAKDYSIYKDGQILFQCIIGVK